jgi:DNA-binding NarL/FixJ family response regulator
LEILEKEGMEDMKPGKEEKEEKKVPDGCPLTPKQLRVLQASHDLDTIVAKEIAEYLGDCSHNTVRAHFQNAAKRLGDHERTKTVAVALEHHWIEENRDRAR